jgi:hypothetical protein
LYRIKAPGSLLLVMRFVLRYRAGVCFFWAYSAEVATKAGQQKKQTEKNCWGLVKRIQRFPAYQRWNVHSPQTPIALGLCYPATR